MKRCNEIEYEKFMTKSFFIQIESKKSFDSFTNSNNQSY